MLIRHILPLLLLALLTVLIGSCTYPDEGYYALIGVNRSGERVSIHPFMVEEITDDTDMTTDFVLFWPRGEDLIEVAVKNNQDTGSRQWAFAIDRDDTGIGTLKMELLHTGGKLYYNGMFQLDPAYMAWPVYGEVVDDPRASWLDNTVDLPPLSGDLAEVTGFDLVEITKHEFEDYFGADVDTARRLLAVPAVITDATELPPGTAAAANQAPKKQQPAARPDTPPEPVGGRDNNRPR